MTMVIFLSVDTGNNNDIVSKSSSALRCKIIVEAQGKKTKAKLTLEKSYKEFGRKLRLILNSNVIKKRQEARLGTQWGIQTLLFHLHLKLEKYEKEGKKKCKSR